MSGKKKAAKLSWQELQAQFGDKSRNPLDNLPTCSRSHADNPRDNLRPSVYDRERRERREEREEIVSRADESSAWRSAGGGSSFRNNDRPFGRSDDAGAWRSSRPTTSSLGGGFSRRDDFSRDNMRDPDSSGRPRLNLIRPSAERLAAAQEQQHAAKALISDDRQSTPKASPFGDAKAVTTKPAPVSDAKTVANKPNPFDEAKPVEKTAGDEVPAAKTVEPWRPRNRAPDSEPSGRFARPTEETSQPSSRLMRPSDDAHEQSNRFSRTVDAAPAPRPRTEPAVVKLTPSLPPKKVPVAAAPVIEKRPVSPVRQVVPEPDTTGPTALEVSMAEGTWVTADELADCIGHVSLNTDNDVEALGRVIALSLANKTVLLPSAVSLIPKAKLADVLKHALLQLVKTLPVDDIERIVNDVDVVQALGLESSLTREEIVCRLKELGLELFIPKEDVATVFKSFCKEAISNQQLISELKSRFPKKAKVSVEVAAVIGEYVTLQSLASGSFEKASLEQYRETLAYITANVKTQTHLLFGVQEAWFSKGTSIKRSGKALFEALYEMRLVSVDALVAWMHDKERTTGKRQLLLQCGGYVSDLQNSAIAHQFENSDSEDSVDLDSDFPQANRNYDDY